MEPIVNCENCDWLLVLLSGAWSGLAALLLMDLHDWWRTRKWNRKGRKE